MKIASLRNLLIGIRWPCSRPGLGGGPPRCAQGPDNNRQQIANVYIVGTRTIPTDKVMQYIHSKLGQFYSVATVPGRRHTAVGVALVQEHSAREDRPDARRPVQCLLRSARASCMQREVIYKHAKHVDTWRARRADAACSPVHAA